MANVQQIRKIIVQEALPQNQDLHQVPDTFLDAAMHDGHPKADTLFESAREHVGSALRSNAPIVIYAVAVAAPPLILYAPFCSHPGVRTSRPSWERHSR